MPKIGRNDPCPCGSGKKYKQCHLPIEEAAAAEQLRLRRSVDTLMPKIIMAAQAQVGAIPAAFERFWEGKYTPAQLEDLDDLEGRGGERFLKGFARRCVRLGCAGGVGAAGGQKRQRGGGEDSFFQRRSGSCGCGDTVCAEFDKHARTLVISGAWRHPNFR